MNKFYFQADHETEIFINGNNGITIRQMTGDINDPEQMITFGSRKRAIEIANAIRKLAMIASFEQIEGDDAI